MKVLIHLKEGTKYLVKEPNRDFHTNQGMIKAADLAKEGKISSSTGEIFACFKPGYSDLWENLKRGPQILLQKDIGLIISKTGINKASKVVDAGGGSGSLCLSLANICKQVVVYETNPDNIKIIQKNQEVFGIMNLSIKQKDVSLGISEKNLDLITLDLPEPWKAIETAQSALKIGGHLVIYLPNLNQLKMFVDAVKGTDIHINEITELIKRDWKIDERIMRPEFQMLGHTGFLTFCRRY